MLLANHFIYENTHVHACLSNVYYNMCVLIDMKI